MILINTPKNQWLKISLIILILLIGAIITYGVVIYNGLLQQKESGYDQSAKQVLAETSLEKIDTKYKYYGEENYHIFFGTTDDKQKQLVFYPLDEEEKDAEDGGHDITTLDQSDIIKKEDIKQEWKKDCQSCTLMKVRPAMDDGTPLWEFTYKDAQERLMLSYFSIKDGSDYETYRFKQMFN